ncbi:MAG TPA: polyphosphate kinase 2 family protein [Tepidisphaeraceae bacterium]|jgi:PPK2 family polyphosphate:nucleotide phosphotransferase|nr:polyphosphate kinase 2 family protein [Tepidisphaeraceae bacterium]
MNHQHFIVPPGKKIRLKDYDPGFTGHYKNKEEAAEKLRKDIERLAKYQEVLYAQNRYALLVVLQAMDTAGKDGTIRHVMSGVNPQGTQVHSFKAPSSEELDHDFLWRSGKALPERGNIGIFNRSYYEEVLVVRVHPELLELQKLPPGAKGKGIWKHRFEEINSFEKYLVRNGIGVLKFFLNISKEEQKRRLLARIDTPGKNWKFSFTDPKERVYWDDYMRCYEDALNHTSTEQAPWHIIPADNKWFTRAAVADVIVEKLKSLKLSYPVVSKEQRRHLLEAKGLLENEGGKRGR